MEHTPNLQCSIEHVRYKTPDTSDSKHSDCVKF